MKKKIELKQKDYKLDFSKIKKCSYVEVLKDKIIIEFEVEIGKKNN